MSVEHGGDLAAARARWGEPPEGWLDLSTGINPVPYPLPDLPAAVWSALPQADALAALLAAARGAYGAAATATVAALPGTQAAIQLLPRLRTPGRVTVLSPTYAEHAACWRAAGHAVTETGELEALAAAEVAVVVNPNNPDGRVLPRETVLDLAEALALRGGWLVVDEAFADVVPAASVADAAGRPGLIVLRSFGKFFGLAGLRLGFALGPARPVADLARALGPWAVSGPALAVGGRALADADWIAATRVRLTVDARRLDAVLTAAGLELAGGTPLFRLVETADAAALAERLAAQGILVRRFAGRPHRLRIGLPGSAAGLDRLARALGARMEPLRRR